MKHWCYTGAVPVPSPEPEHHTVSLGQTRIHYVVAGTGPTWLLVHGMMGSWRNFAAWWPLFTAHFRVVVPDLPGCGQSPELTGPHSGAANADALRALARNLPIEPVGVAALGLGAAPTIAALVSGLPAQHLVVYSPVYGSMTVRTRFRLIVRLARPRRVTAGLAWLARQERALNSLSRWLGQEAGSDEGAPHASSTSGDVRRASVRAALELVHDAVTRDQRPQLARLATPTLALAAPDDPLLPASATLAIPHLMPRAQAVLLPPARHGWPPHVVAAQMESIARFLGLPDVPVGG